MKTLYFLNKGDLLSESMTLPIKPVKMRWCQEVNPTRLVRSFEFETYEKLTFFVEQLMRFSGRLGHHPNIMIMGDKSVLVETYTHELNDVTDQDIRVTKMADQIYKDSRYIGEELAEDGIDDNNDERLSEGYRFDWTTNW